MRPPAGQDPYGAHKLIPAGALQCFPRFSSGRGLWHSIVRNNHSLVCRSPTPSWESFVFSSTARPQAECSALQIPALSCRPIRQENQRPPDPLTLSSCPCMKATFAIWKRQTALELRSGSGLPRLAAPAGYRAVRVDDGPPVVGLLRQAQRSMQQSIGLIQFALHGAELRAESGTERRNPFTRPSPAGLRAHPAGESCHRTAAISAALRASPWPSSVGG